MPSGSHMDVHRLCDLTVVHLFKWISNLGPRAFNMLQAGYLNPALPGYHDIGRLYAVFHQSTMCNLYCVWKVVSTSVTW